MLIVAAGSLTWAIRRFSGNTRLGAAWFAIALAPALAFRSLFPLDIAQDRYLYLPSVGLALMAAVWLSRVEFTLPVVIAVPALALALWAGTESNLRIWQDDISLFRRAVETAPENPIMKDNLATAYLNQGRPADALPLLRQVVAMLPIYGHGYYNLGRCYHQMGNDAEAERYFSIADQILSVNRAFYKEQVQGKFR